MILIFENIPVGPLQCNCYILGCENTREALVIDPGDEIELILPSLEKHQLNVRYILSTHAHIDHVGDLEKLKDKTGAETLYMKKICTYIKIYLLRLIILVYLFPLQLRLTTLFTKVIRLLLAINPLLATKSKQIHTLAMSCLPPVTLQVVFVFISQKMENYSLETPYFK